MAFKFAVFNKDNTQAFGEEYKDKNLGNKSCKIFDNDHSS